MLAADQRLRQLIVPFIVGMQRLFQSQRLDFIDRNIILCSGSFRCGLTLGRELCFGCGLALGWRLILCCCRAFRFLRLFCILTASCQAQEHTDTEKYTHHSFHSVSFLWARIEWRKKSLQTMLFFCRYDGHPEPPFMIPAQ